MADACHVHVMCMACVLSLGFLLGPFPIQELDGQNLYDLFLVLPGPAACTGPLP